MTLCFRLNIRTHDRFLKKKILRLNSNTNWTIQLKSLLRGGHVFEFWGIDRDP